MLGPLCAIASVYLHLILIFFFMGVHHGSESGTEFKKKNEQGGPRDSLTVRTRGVALRCVEGGWGASELQTRDAWLLVPPSSNPM